MTPDAPQFVSTATVKGMLVMSDAIEGGVTRMLRMSIRTSPPEVLPLLDLMCELLGAQAARSM